MFELSEEWKQETPKKPSLLDVGLRCAFGTYLKIMLSASKFGEQWQNARNLVLSSPTFNEWAKKRSTQKLMKTFEN